MEWAWYLVVVAVVVVVVAAVVLASFEPSAERGPCFAGRLVVGQHCGLGMGTHTVLLRGQVEEKLLLY